MAPIPHQLPPASRLFVDRATERAELAAQAAGGLLVVTGMPGTGKTALVTQWAQEHAEEFPDGHLHADMATADVDEVLGGWVRALGVAPDAVPVRTSDLIGLWRSLSYRRRLLVAVDNVVEPRQVLTLLPGASRSLLVVTSRHRLVELALAGARFLPVSALTSEAILDLLTIYAGPIRVEAERDQLRTLALACRQHPLTAHLLGAQLAARPEHGITALATTFRHNTARHPWESALTIAHATLSDDAALLHRRLPLLPAPRFCVNAAAALMDTSADRATAALAELFHANLVDPIQHDRWQVPEPLRQSDTLHDHDEERVRTAARLRVLEHYLRHTAAVEHRLAPGTRRLAALYATPLPEFGDRAAAVAWLDVERTTVLAAQELAERLGRDDLVWKFGEALWAGLRQGGHLEQMVIAQLRAAMAADRLDHLYAAAAWARAAWAQSLLEQHDSALESGAVALQRAHTYDDAWSLSTVNSILTQVWRAVGDPSAALIHNSEAIAADRARNAPAAALGLRYRDRALVFSDLRQHHAAVDAARNAVRLLDTDPRRAVEAGRARTTYARVLLTAGQPEPAVAILMEALPALHAAAAPLYPAEAHELLGHAATALRDVEMALEQYRTARELFVAAGHPVHAQRLDAHLESDPRA
ncbi:MAG TPA: NB-ARC domain-containing protein [Umezawaea sp.]|nr:NB-ARC domain-containing protein [Umezawaea sp.]